MLALILTHYGPGCQRIKLDEVGFITDNKNQGMFLNGGYTGIDNKCERSKRDSPTRQLLPSSAMGKTSNWATT